MSARVPRGFSPNLAARKAAAAAAALAIAMAAIPLAALIAGGGLAGCAPAAAPPPKNAASAPAAAAVVVAGPAAAPVVGPPLRLVPAIEARPALLASISIPSVDRLLANGTALISRAVPLPMDAASVKEMLLTQAGLPAQVGDNLDTNSPSGAVVVAVGGGKGSVGLVMAIPAKGPAQARLVLSALGRMVSRRGEVIEIDNGAGGRGWAWQSGNVIVISDSVDALARGAALALEARQLAAGDDVTAVLHPEAIARANGTDLKTGLARFVAQARAAQPDASIETLQDLAGYVADTDTVEIGLAVDAARGLLGSLRLRPRPGSGLEKLAHQARTFEIDSALLPALSAAAPGARDEIATLFAINDGPFIRDQLARQRQRLQASSEKGSAQALQFFDASLEAIGGSCSGVGRTKPTLSFQVVQPLKDQASAAKLAAAMARLDAASVAAVWRAQVTPAQQKMLDWTFKKEKIGKLKALHYTLAPGAARELTPEARAAVKKLLGGMSLDIYQALVGSRWLVTGGKDGKARLLALANGPKGGGKGGPAKGAAASSATSASSAATTSSSSSGATTGASDAKNDLAQALAAAKGKDSFAYLDLAQFLGLVASFAEDPRATLLAAGASAPIPVYGTFGADGQGKAMTFALTIPPSAFAGVGAILQGMGGAAGGGASK